MKAHRKAVGALGALLVLLSSALPAANAQAPAAPAAKGADEAAILAAGRARDDAYEALKADGIVAPYADDAVLMPQTAPVAKGRAAILKYVQVYLDKLADGGFKLTVAKTVDIVVSGDLAVRSGTYAIKNKAGKTMDTGKWIEVWRKSGGKWRIARDIVNSDTLPLLPPPDMG